MIEKTLAQNRCGPASITIKTARYRNGRHLPSEKQICPLCHEENEFHVFHDNNVYGDIRVELF